MRLEIDTENKTIKLLKEVSFKELTKTLKDLLGKQMDEYKIIPDTTANYYPYYPYNYPTTPFYKYTDNTGTEEFINCNTFTTTSN